jgi:hypothetical protein
MFRKIVNNLIYIIGLIVIGYILGVYVNRPSDSSLPVLDPETLDSLLVGNENKRIDSLELIIEDYKKINNNLRDSIEAVTITRVIEVDAVKKLPLDSGVIFLRQKLREFESK